MARLVEGPPVGGMAIAMPAAMKAALSYVVVLAVGTMACSGSVVTTTQSTQGNGGSGGNGGAGGGGAGGNAEACNDLLAEPAEAVTVNVVNTTGVPLYIYDECFHDGADGTAIDDHGLSDDWYSNTCDESLSCQTVIGDCFGGDDYELPAGATYTSSWTGLLIADESTTIPEACKKACMVFADCTKRLAAKPGTHTLAVRYATTAKGDYKIAKLDFELPATEVTLTIASP